ncbi:MAG: ATP-binding cassette domain-containing protein [Lentisphaeria bacterium]|nr:ATP-binding cassette domain-containing protein [Candidatus Neomarinimicrobiota bacterium]MCF7842319.1 ATP-binding cassette domain-containing protein [Lentisphaeria bacterium]
MSIVINNLRKQFGHALVVNNVSLEIQEGELFVLLGASGSGKSTILRIIAGLLEPDSGSVTINGVDMTHVDARKRNVGMVFQNYSLFGHLTVFENVEFGLQVRKLPKAQRRNRSKELLEAVGLTGLGHRYPAQLSGGQQQRVAVARALAYNPRVLLMDEPFGALDVKIRGTLRQNLQEIQRRLNVTTILVTHDQEEAFELADRIGVIERGQLIEIGPPDVLYHHPKTEIVATFIGGGNILVGREEEGRIRLGKVFLPMPDQAPLHAQGSPVRVLFRPETVVLSREAFSNASGIYPLGQGRVLKRIFNGPVQRLVLEMEELAGVRPLKPVPRYGQPRTRIEVVETTTGLHHGARFDETLWVGVRDYHILEPSGIKFLVYTGSPERNPAAQELALHLGQLTRGAVTLFSVVSNDMEMSEVQAEMERIQNVWQERIPLLTTEVVKGERHEQVYLKTQSGIYDILVADPKFTGQHEMKPALQNLLEETLLPVLTVSQSQKGILHILICTAAGEPGKSDVQVGGRLAMRAHAKATVFSVLTSPDDQVETRRVEQHLEQARQSLTGLGIACDTRLGLGEPMAEIFNQAAKPAYDLVVLGAPLPQAPQRIHWPDVAQRITRELNKPVLLVPMMTT